MTVGNLSRIFFLCSPKQEVGAFRVVLTAVSPMVVLGIWPLGVAWFLWGSVIKRGSLLTPCQLWSVFTGRDECYPIVLMQMAQK